jgi:DNA-binding response OmpR family regulator
MFPTTKNLPAEIPSTENITLLLVSPCPEDYSSLKSLLSAGGWTIHRCSSTGEALQHISSERPSLVISERDLPDGTWKTILASCEASQSQPLVLVVSRYADENLWAEVLNLGGYDVLLKPFDRSEVNRVVAMAWRHWLGQTEQEKEPTLPVSLTRPSTPQYV